MKIRTESLNFLKGNFLPMEIEACYENLKKFENDVSAAVIGLELQRCNAEETAALYRAEFFHKSTQAWLQARQKMLMLEVRLPVGVLTEDEAKDVFPPENQPNAARRLPFDELQSIRKRLHKLRKILEEKVKTRLTEI